MKLITSILLLLFVTIAEAQHAQPLETNIEKYTHKIDSLRTTNKLVKLSYMDMVACAGSLDGYYANSELLLLETVYSAELGYSSRTYFYQKGILVKIVYRESFAEWMKYEQNYPSDKFEFDPSKMTYTDTFYTFTFGKEINCVKNPGKDIIKTAKKESILDELLHCETDLKLLLTKMRAKIDSLKFIESMPYINEMGLDGDSLFWVLVKFQQGGIEYLIDKLDDKTQTLATVPNFGSTYTVADVAYTALQEIIHGLPTFEFLGVPFDTTGCGYCAYWQHLNKDLENRKQFKQAVLTWYHQHKEQLVWVNSNVFTSCDCSGKHPAGGHYELKEKSKMDTK